MDQIIEHLKHVYNVQKIVVLGYSWGSIIGSLYSFEHPENVSCYIGTGQFISVENLGEVQSNELIKKARKLNDKNVLIDLESTSHLDKKMIQKYIKKFQGDGMDGMNFFEMGKLFLKSPNSKLKDIYPFFKTHKANKNLFHYLEKFNLESVSFVYKIPIFYILGENDLQTPITLAVNYFDKIQAPVKELIIIENAGHAPMFRTPEEYYVALSQVSKILSSN